VLGAFHALYPAVCVATLVLLCLLRAWLRRGPAVEAEPHERGLMRYGVLVVTIVMVTWPAIVRPLLEGDSLGYHLPNAASWSHAHSIWTTTTTYWWYPPASELFACGLYTVAGPFSLGLAGTVAVVLLGLRLTEWGSLSAPGWAAGLIAAATVSVPAFALQSGNMQNDVWLAAWMLEALWVHRKAGEGAVGTPLAMLSLVKPMGILYALGVHVLSRAGFSKRAVLAYLPFALWLVHDAILAPHAVVSAKSTSYGALWEGTIAGHGLDGLMTLFHALAAFAGPVFCLLLVAALCVTPFHEYKRLAPAAFALALLYAFLPFAYSNRVPQLAVDGSSLRYLIPVPAIGALGVMWVARRFAWPVAFVAAAATMLGVHCVASIFWNDSTTHNTALVGLAYLAWLCVPRRMQEPLGVALLLATIASANTLAGSHPADYYNDALRNGGEKTSVFSWLATAKPQRLVVQDVRSGAVNVVSPGTSTIDATNADACGQAREFKALLLLGPDSRYDRERFEARRAAAERCGAVAYEDRLSLIVQP
jgi:hypothetical protein